MSMHFGFWRNGRAGFGAALRRCGLRLSAVLLAAAPLDAGAPLLKEMETLRGFQHDKWPVELGAPSRINAISQTPDGYLWIGSVEGLFRFDGVKFTKVPFPQVAPESVVVSQLEITRAGEVWVGLARRRGVAVVRGGRLVDAAMPNPSREVNDVVEDAQGGIWVARGGRSRNTLARYADGHWQEFGVEAGLPEQQVWGILLARDGSLWVVCDSVIVVRRPGAARFEPTGLAGAARASLGQDAQGGIWLSDEKGTRLIKAGGGNHAPQAKTRFYPRSDQVGGSRMLFDRAGNLWETTWNDGVVLIHSPSNDGQAAPAPRRNRLAAFNASDGLTSDQSRALFQDREGNIWVGTELGLDKLRPARVVVEPAIPANPPTSYRMASASDGTVYIADATALYAILPRQSPRRMFWLDTPAEALCAGWSSGVWLVTGKTVSHVDGNGTRAVSKPAGVRVLGCAQDRDGRLWLPALEKGLFTIERGKWSEAAGPHVGSALPANAVVGPQGKAIIQFRATPQKADASGYHALYDASSHVGMIEGVMPGRAAIYVSGAKGLAAHSGPKAALLDVRNYPWAASLNGMVQTPSGDTWAIGDGGIIRLRTSDLAKALNKPGRDIAYKTFDFRDGVNSFAQKAPGAQVAAGGDGRIWFLTRGNVLSIDPSSISANTVPPTVMIESISANGIVASAKSGISLPAGTTSVAIEYTATSLTQPQRVRFRYRLAGHAAKWASTSQRRVMFSGLDAGDYIFEVMAANEDGTWSTKSQSLAFTIERYFYQEWWFKVCAALAISAILYVLYQLRIGYLLRRVEERLHERATERERIARELHDTLLQGVQGLIMRFQSVADRHSQDAAAQALMLPALDRAEALLVEGRDRVKGLRRMGDRNLESELAYLVEGQDFGSATRCWIATRGSVRVIDPEIMDDILGIVSEALFNVARHAQAGEVEINVDYGRKALAIFVRDDGVGLSSAVMWSGERAGHYGLRGMRERAKRLNARLTIESGAGFGTLISFRISARLAYSEGRNSG